MSDKKTRIHFITNDGEVSFNFIDVPSFCAGAILYCFSSSIGKPYLSYEGSSMEDCLMKFMEDKHLTSVCINDIEGGVGFLCFLSDVCKNIPDTGGVVKKQEFTYVLSPPYENKNTGSSVVSATIIYTGGPSYSEDYESGEDFFDDPDEDGETW